MRFGRNVLSGERFDELAKDLAARATSRRRFLAGVAGAGATALLGPWVARADGGPGGSDCVNQGQSCTAQKCCQGLACLLDGTSSTDKFCCVPLSPLVCGSRCCPTGALTNCVSGKCACPLGEIECPDLLNPAGKCINPLTDVDNCGGCGIKCGECFKCSNGICVPDPGKPCNDNNACTANDTCTATGACVGTLVDCDDGNPCTIDTCDPATGCVHTTAPNGTPCDDGNACTQTDSCQGGTCVGSNPVVCTPLDQCHEAGTCNPATGVCSNPAKPNGTPCDDGNACTQTDTCQSGTCVGGDPVVCAPLDQCHEAGTCDPTTGLCSNPAKPNGAACNDGNACTENDVCTNGVCQGTPVNCDDGNPCTIDTCDPSTGCVYANAAAGTPCPDDGNQCTNDVCDGTGICTHPAKTDGAVCDDGDPCTVNDVCTNGVCQGTAKSCDDGNPCTTDTCDSSTGNCVHNNVGNNTSCGTGQICCSGTCVSNNTPTNCGTCGHTCTGDQVCCTSGMHAGDCKLPAGKVCKTGTGNPNSGNGLCCSNNCGSCTGSGSTRQCFCA